MRAILSKITQKFGYEIKKDRSKEMYPEAFLRDYAQVKPYTMVDPSGAHAAWEAVNYVAQREIKGAFVECGVWRGGISMLMALRAVDLKERRDKYLYDTFEGMTEPTEHDTDKHGIDALSLLKNSLRIDESNSVWAYASQEAVENNLRRVGCSGKDVYLVKGKVENTIPETVPQEIAILRLDTDWYESTRHELEHLYPRLQTGGVLLIDDYGYWTGCRKAVDEYFMGHTYKPYMTILQNGGLTAIKI
jgi:O-methyltransferase